MRNNGTCSPLEDAFEYAFARGLGVGLGSGNCKFLGMQLPCMWSLVKNTTICSWQIHHRISVHIISTCCTAAQTRSVPHVALSSPYTAANECCLGCPGQPTPSHRRQLDMRKGGGGKWSWCLCWTLLQYLNTAAMTLQKTMQPAAWLGNTPHPSGRPHFRTPRLIPPLRDVLLLVA